MVVALQIMIEDSVVHMIQLQQMLEGSCSFLVQELNIVDLDRFNIDSRGAGGSKEAR